MECACFSYLVTMCLHHAQSIVLSSARFQEKVYILINIAWVIFLFSNDIIHNEHIDEF